MSRRVLVTVGALVVAGIVTFGARGSIGLFVKPWEEAFGVGRGAVSMIAAVGFIAYGIGQVVAGRLVGAFGGRRVLLIGLVLMTVGFGAGSAAGGLTLAVLTIGLIASFGGGFASLNTMNFIAADLIEQRSGTVFGVLTAAGAGGVVIILPIATAVLGVSLRSSLFTIAVLLALTTVLVAVLVRDHAKETASKATPIGGLKVLVRTPGFWLLLVPFAVCGYTSTGLTDTHLIPYATDHHLSEATASAALATLAAFNVAGVLVAGVFTDRVDRGKLLAGVYLLRAVSLFLLPALTSPTLLFVFAALFGIADFASVPPTTSLTRTVCIKGGWGFALGLIGASHQVGSAFGAWFGGWVFEQTGDYEISFLLSAVALLVAAGLSYSLRSSRLPAEPALA
jgi:MFS family permease